jgi:hypothetical protein
MSQEDNKHLFGVKEIAKYLNMSVSSVYRWEKNLDLPLHRVADKDGYTVYADKDDLDDWLSNLRSKDISRPRKVKKSLILSIPVIAIGVLSIYLILTNRLGRDSDINNRFDSLMKKSAEKLDEKDHIGPEIFTTEGCFVQVKSRSGEFLWSYRMAEREIGNKYLYKYMSISDIDNDNFKEVASKTYDVETDRSYLCLFDHDGKEIWRRSIDTNQTFSNITIGDDFFCGTVKFALSENKSPRIISLWRNNVRFLSIIACHDLAGNLLYQYLNIGHIGDFELYDLNDDGVKEIIFAGTNNLLNGEGIFGVLSLTGFHGVSPPYRIEPEYSDLSFHLSVYVPDNPVPGDQLAYIRFKKTQYLQEFQKQHMKINILSFNKGILNVELEFSDFEDNPNRGLFFCFVFDRSLSLKYVIPMRGTSKYYPEKVEKGEIDIPLDDLLDVLEANVLWWQDGHWILNPGDE